VRTPQARALGVHSERARQRAAARERLRAYTLTPQPQQQQQVSAARTELLAPRMEAETLLRKLLSHSMPYTSLHALRNSHTSFSPARGAGHTIRL